jgi:hypothetical protein
MNKQLQAMKQAREALRCAFQNDVSDCAAAIIELDIAIENAEKQECETCAAKRKRLMDAGFLKSPLRGGDHVD